MAQDNDTKTCLVCKKEFTRQEKKLTKLQWMGRKYCSLKCSKKDPDQRRWGYFG